MQVPHGELTLLVISIELNSRTRNSAISLFVWLPVLINISRNIFDESDDEERNNALHFMIVSFRGASIRSQPLEDWEMTATSSTGTGQISVPWTSLLFQPLEGGEVPAYSCRGTEPSVQWTSLLSLNHWTTERCPPPVAITAPERAPERYPRPRHPCSVNHCKAPSCPYLAAFK